MNKRWLGVTVLVCVTATGVGCKKSDDIVVGLARSTYTKAKAEADKGDYKSAYDSCKLIDDDGLRKEDTDDAKKLLQDIQSLCQVDVPASQEKASIEKAYSEFQAAVASDPSTVDFKKSGVESECTMGKTSAGYFDTYKGSDRPSAKALADTMAKDCTPEALTVKTPPAAATATAAATAGAKTGVKTASATPPKAKTKGK